VEDRSDAAPTETDLEKATAHAILTLQNNPIWGISAYTLVHVIPGERMTIGMTMGVYAGRSEVDAN